MDEKIRAIIGKHTQVDSSETALGEGDDLYAAGMTSQASVSLMLALEDEFDIEFPDSMLKRSVFESVASIRTALSELSDDAAA